MSDRCLHLDVEIESNERLIEFGIEGSTTGRLPYYNGDYVVDPRKVSQTLPTANKSMREDVVVNEIYYAETSNEGGGYTAVIGLE